jgi:ribosomal protein S18 acetylase RimI-like enzyme
MTYSIKYISKPRTKLKKQLGAGLDSYNKSKMGFINSKDLGLEARNHRGVLVGGLVGHTYWGWLQIYELCVHKTYRRQGLGSTLLHHAEALAKKRGCKYIQLDTFSFQAPGFYKKLGFKSFGVLKPFPKGQARHYFFKKIGTT